MDSQHQLPTYPGLKSGLEKLAREEGRLAREAREGRQAREGQLHLAYRYCTLPLHPCTLYRDARALARELGMEEGGRGKVQLQPRGVR